MNKRQVLLAAAIASLSLVNVAQANEVASISDVAVKSAQNACKGAAHSCAGYDVKAVVGACKDVAGSCADSGVSVI